MTGGRVLKAAGALAAAWMCLAVPMAHAQVEDSGDDGDAAQQLAEDVGCVATYDVILAAGHGKIKAEESLRHARDAALNAFRQDSDLPETQVREAVAQADRALPDLLRQAHQSLAEYKTACDAAFMANPFADYDAQPV
jgi:nicotinic acid phosphoribosyltransferase